MKQRFFQGVVNHRKTVVVIFALAALVCLALGQLVRVDYEINDYLPDNTASTVALNTMDAEFDNAVPNARVMVKQVSIAEALDYKAKLKAIDGVSGVTWLDDAIPISTPLELADQDTVTTYYKEGNALFSLTIDDDKRESAVSAIRDLIGPDNAMTGSSISTSVATTSTLSQIAVITVA
ncbi:MAG: RND family transporter, partial [Eggerthellaceae bacterium]